MHFTVIISLVVWSDTGSERDNETNVDSWR